jgi:hypothetical protein
MWKDTHLVERDLEMRVDMERRMNIRLREAEQWRLWKGTKNSRKASGFSPGNLFNLSVTTLRSWLAGSPKPQEKGC